MIALETANQLTNAKIVGPVGNSDYMRQDVKRGDPKFVMSRSELKNFAVCPSRWLAGYREETTKEMGYGDLLDCLLFTPVDFPVRFVVAPDTYPAKGKKKDDPEIQKPWNRNADYCREWEEVQSGTVIKVEQLQSAQNAKAVLLKDPAIKSMIRASDHQTLITAEYEDRDTRLTVHLKGLVDIAPGNEISEYDKCLADFKTCNSAHPIVWAKEVNKYGYDMQSALYLDIWNAATGEDRCEFRHVLQENFPPYQIGKRILSQEFLNIGRAKYQSALRLYCQCLATDTWPNYETGNEVIDGWSITQPDQWMLA